MLYSAQLHLVLAALKTSKLTAAEFVLTLLEDCSLQNHPCTVNLACNAENIISAFSAHSLSAKSTFAWASSLIKTRYTESIKALVQNDNFRFNASHASAQNLEDFRIEDMAGQMKELAPDLWDVLDLLLSADRKLSCQRDLGVDNDGDQIMNQEEDEDLWAALPDVTEAGLQEEEAYDVIDENGIAVPKQKLDAKRKAARKEAIRTIVCSYKSLWRGS